MGVMGVAAMPSAAERPVQNHGVARQLGILRRELLLRLDIFDVGFGKVDVRRQPVNVVRPLRQDIQALRPQPPA